MKAQYRSSLQILLAVCGVVLLIACANVANLMLARAVSRRTQTAVRLAIGASRSTLVFQALVEAIVLALIGAAAGLVVAMGASRLLLALAFANVQFLPINTAPSLMVPRLRDRLALLTGHLRRRARRGSRRAPIRSTRCAAAAGASRTAHRSRARRCSSSRRRCRSCS